MLLALLGWFWIITGIIFLFKPEKLRNLLQKKSVKKLKRTFFWLALILSLLLIKSVWGIPGLLAKIILIAGMIGIFKAVFFLKGQTSEALIEWYIHQPIKFFRTGAIIQIIFGAILLSI